MKNVRKDLMKMYKNTKMFDKLVIKNNFNPVYILSEYYPDYIAILSKKYIKELFENWKP